MILVLDGASIHTSKLTLGKFEEWGIKTLEDWPPHSPDFNPIENMWARVKEPCIKRLSGITKQNATAKKEIFQIISEKLAGC